MLRWNRIREFHGQLRCQYMLESHLIRTQPQALAEYAVQL